MSSENRPPDDPPKSIWEVNQRLQYDEALAPNDPRWVDTVKARGGYIFEPLYRRLGVDPEAWALRGAPRRSYILFCGHRGCGKSTELRRVHDRLDRPELFFSVLLDAAKKLDPNNLRYQDVFLGLAEALLAQLAESGVEIEQVFLSRLESWFDERVEKHEETRAFAAEVKSGVKGEAGIPFLSKIFAELRTAVSVGSTYKEELRRVVRNHFSEFAAAFNQLITAAEQACAERGLGERVLFLVDGTDRLDEQDADAFFVRDVFQLQLAEALFIYAAPIHLLHGGSSVNHNFTATTELPMVKLVERDRTRCEEGWRAMRKLLFKRAPRALFDEEATADYLIEHSGGHPRDLLRLLQYAHEHARGELFDRPAAERAVRGLAGDYRQFLDAEDFALLRQIDSAPAGEHGSERARELLYHLALLQYEDEDGSYWWRSHPTVRTLGGYRSTEEG